MRNKGPTFRNYRHDETGMLQRHFSMPGEKQGALFVSFAQIFTTTYRATRLPTSYLTFLLSPNRAVAVYKSGGMAAKGHFRDLREPQPRLAAQLGKYGNRFTDFKALK